ncbi:MAG: hypothetical protein JOY90_25475 [Bradyrhizobium sp.]|uniref:hypothetical protein n=1 Tax=Bradyrhizobium sp. TaxID=376 RepID=UPI001D21E65C|nr:hypothetical protein [Bradyrhizobium sp.]MBV9563767.1 hypothetical protein [Bradyrhizobium sp.]
MDDQYREPFTLYERQGGQLHGATSRRHAMARVGFWGLTLAALHGKAWAQRPGSFSNEALALPTGRTPSDADAAIRDVKIARAMRAGPMQITKNATVAELDREGNMTAILREGSNDWVCTPGDENRIGDPPMCIDRIGMQWFKDLILRKPHPSNTVPGLCYMLCGATQHSNSNAFDTASPAIPIGPHWMVLWPFDSAHCGLPTDVRDAGAWIMFAGTPYAYLHICGSPWVGNSYTPEHQPVWTMRYVKRGS